MVEDRLPHSDCRLRLPVGYTMEHVRKHIATGRMVVKMAVPAHMYGERIAVGGEVVGVADCKHIVIGPGNQELSAAGPMSPQDLHFHRGIVETYTTYGWMLLHYLDGGRINTIEARHGQTIIVPPQAIHKAEIFGDGPTFVTMSGKGEIKDDKYVIQYDGALERDAIYDLMRN